MAKILDIDNQELQEWRIPIKMTSEKEKREKSSKPSSPHQIYCYLGVEWGRVALGPTQDPLWFQN